LPEGPAPELFAGDLPVPDFGAWAAASARQAQQPPPESVELEPVELNPAQDAAEAMETPEWAAEPVVWEEPPVAPAEDLPQAAPASEEVAAESVQSAAAPAPEPAADAAPDRPKKRGWWPFRRGATKGPQEQPSPGTTAKGDSEGRPAVDASQAPEAPPSPLSAPPPAPAIPADGSPPVSGSSEEVAQAPAPQESESPEIDPGLEEFFRRLQ